MDDEVDEDPRQDNIVAALEHHDRVIRIDPRHFPLETFTAVTRKPFPVLTHVYLRSFREIAPVLHDEFLGESAPRLREFILRSIAFPAFPKLALSATHLSRLIALDIPIAGYISPEAMATCLASLPSLEWLDIGFKSPQSRPDRIGFPPPTRAVLPALIRFKFKGASEYLEDLLARIDSPKLIKLEIEFFMDLMFNIPQLYKFIVRTERIRSLNLAEIVFFPWAAEIILGPPGRTVALQIICREPEWQASSVARVFNQLSSLLSHVEQLRIREGSPSQARQGVGINPTLFLELLDPFSALQYLHIYGGLRPLVARALRELTVESATEALPSLRSLVFQGPSQSESIQKDIEGFITARQNSNHPVDVEWKG